MSSKIVLPLIAAVTFAGLSGCSTKTTKESTVRRDEGVYKPSVREFGKEAQDDTTSGTTIDTSDEPADDIEASAVPVKKYNGDNAVTTEETTTETNTTSVSH
jgi:hypothetical protein